jgi:hypothetical protein
MIIVVVCLRLTQQDEMKRFYISIHGLNTSDMVRSGLRITQGSIKNVEVPSDYSSANGVGELRGMEGSDATMELTKLDGISSRTVHGKREYAV